MRQWYMRCTYGNMASDPHGTWMVYMAIMQCNTHDHHFNYQIRSHLHDYIQSYIHEYTSVHMGTILRPCSVQVVPQCWCTRRWPRPWPWRPPRQTCCRSGRSRAHPRARGERQRARRPTRRCRAKRRASASAWSTMGVGGCQGRFKAIFNKNTEKSAFRAFMGSKRAPSNTV